MTGKREEVGQHVQAAKDRSAEVCQALEGDAGDGAVEDPSVWDAINQALYDIDYALARATLAAKLYVTEAGMAADDGYDDLMEDIRQASEGVKGFHEDLTESRPARAIGDWFRGLDERLDGLLERIRGDEGD